MSDSSKNRQLTYLTLEAPRVGQASHVHVKEIIAGLQRRSWNVRLLQPSYTDALRKPGAVSRLVDAVVSQLKLWLGRSRGEMIYVRAHFLAFPTALLAKCFGVPIAHEINGAFTDIYVTYGWLGRLRWLIDPMWRVQFRWADLLLPVTQELAEWLVGEAGHSRIVVVPNGANTDLFRPDVPPAEGIPSRPFAVFFGGLARWHGVDVMLKAAASPHWPDQVDLVIIGDGQERALVEAAARDNPRVRLMGYQPYDRIPSFVAPALCGLVVISDPGGRSRTGVLPLKLFETLACGVPVIVTDLPGQADLVRAGGCGLVVAVDDADAVAVAVGELTGDKVRAREMGLKGLQAVRSDHSWDQRAGSVSDLLERLVKSPNAAAGKTS